ncbi:MAG: hypothetical protein V1827_03865 [Candidatus Micrarchaeota archaeon]
MEFAKVRERLSERLLDEWGGCELEFVRAPADARGHISLQGRSGDWFLVDRKGKRKQLDASWLDTYMLAFGGKTNPDRIFKRVREVASVD